MTKVVEIGERRIHKRLCTSMTGQSFEATYWEFMALNAQGQYTLARNLLEYMKRNHYGYYLDLVIYKDFEYFVIGDITHALTRALEETIPEEPDQL